MKYIIMCGGDYKKWKTPKQLIRINGEPVNCIVVNFKDDDDDDEIEDEDLENLELPF